MPCRRMSRSQQKAMFARMGRENKRLKPVKTWVNDPRRFGLYQRTVYIKNEKPYSFKTDDGGSLQVFARSKNEAIKKAKSWERWVAKKGFQTKVKVN